MAKGKLKLSWKHIEELTQSIYDQAKERNFVPDCIVPLSRGGLIPARILSDLFGVHDILPIRVKFYDAMQHKIAPIIENFPYKVFEKSILIVDDIIDSGMSIQTVLKHFNNYATNKPKRMVVCSLVVRSGCISMPSYYGEKIDNDDWIVFPWEKDIQ